jgi:hypothetical protein
MNDDAVEAVVYQDQQAGGCKTFCVNVVFLHNKENDGDRQ